MKINGCICEKRVFHPITDVWKFANVVIISILYLSDYTTCIRFATCLSDSQWLNGFHESNLFFIKTFSLLLAEAVEKNTTYVWQSDIWNKRRSKLFTVAWSEGILFSYFREGKKLDIPISFWTAFMFPLNLLWWFLST